MSFVKFGSCYCDISMYLNIKRISHDCTCSLKRKLQSYCSFLPLVKNLKSFKSNHIHRKILRFAITKPLNYLAKLLFVLSVQKPLITLENVLSYSLVSLLPFCQFLFIKFVSFQNVRIFFLYPLFWFLSSFSEYSIFFNYKQS